MIALNRGALAELPGSVARFGYDRDAVRAGIAHFSVGNFHRAHQAWYLDALLSLPGNEGWGICGIGIVDDATERLKTETFPAQDDLYTLTLCPADAPARVQVIGSIVEYFFAPGIGDESDHDAVLERLDDPAIRIVSMTITEGGYNIDAQTGAFRLDHPAVARDLAHPGHPHTVFGYVIESLARRRAAGTAPFTVLSCDNLRHNGAVAKRAFTAFARARDPGLADWIEANVAFPSCMVDRITPAVLAEKAEALNAASGIDDKLPVFAEDFAQWVIEDRFSGGRPTLEQVGVTFTDDVGAYESVKLRMLNASHTMLALPGLGAGFATVDEAMGEPRLRRLLEDFLDRDVIPLLTAPPGMELVAYRDAVLRRFSNPVIGDQLARIAFDTASKIPVFLGDTIAETLARGRDHRRLAFLLAVYGRTLAGRGDQGDLPRIAEPNLGPADLALAQDADPASILKLSTFGDWGLDRHADFIEDLRRRRARIEAVGTLKALSELWLGDLEAQNFQKSSTNSEA